MVQYKIKEKKTKGGILVKKGRVILIICLLVVVLIAGILVFNNTKTATDVLENANFNAENPSVGIESIDVETEDIFTSIKIPKETQQELIKAFKNAKFKEVKDGSSDYDYRIQITLNTGYGIYVVSDKKLLKIIDTGEYYTIENDNNFFSILNEVTK